MGSIEYSTPAATPVVKEEVVTETQSLPETEAVQEAEVSAE